MKQNSKWVGVSNPLQNSKWVGVSNAQQTQNERTSKNTENPLQKPKQEQYK
jgi:hypothetical protein